MTSIYQTYTDEALEQALLDAEAEREALDSTISSIENIICRRKHFGEKQIENPYIKKHEDGKE